MRVRLIIHGFNEELWFVFVASHMACGFKQFRQRGFWILRGGTSRLVSFLIEAAREINGLI